MSLRADLDLANRVDILPFIILINIAHNSPMPLKGRRIRSLPFEWANKREVYTDHVRTLVGRVQHSRSTAWLRPTISMSSSIGHLQFPKEHARDFGGQTLRLATCGEGRRAEPVFPAARWGQTAPPWMRGERSNGVDDDREKAVAARQLRGGSVSVRITYASGPPRNGASPPSLSAEDFEAEAPALERACALLQEGAQHLTLTVDGVDRMSHESLVRYCQSDRRQGRE